MNRDDTMKGKVASDVPGDVKNDNSAAGAHGDGDCGAGSTDVVDSEAVFQLANDDVLLGRGTRVHIHVGNKRFRVIVEGYARSYALADKNRSLRRKIAYKVIDTVHQTGGRFLRGDVGSATKCWYIASEQAVFTKVKQALRDAGASRAADWRESDKRSRALAAAATKTSLSRSMVRNATAKAATVRQSALRMQLDQALELLLQQRATASVTEDLLSRRMQLKRQQLRLATAATKIVGSSNSSALTLQQGNSSTISRLLQGMVMPDRTTQALLEAQLRSQLDQEQLLARRGARSSMTPQDLFRHQQVPLAALSTPSLQRSIRGLRHRTRP